VSRWQNAFSQLKESGQLREIAQKWQQKLATELQVASKVENHILVL